jgi:hypothetical protein
MGFIQRRLVGTAWVLNLVLGLSPDAAAADRSAILNTLNRTESTYGYIGDSSLLDADRVLDFSCEQPVTTATKDCVPPVEPPIGTELADSTSKVSLTQLLREKTFEYLALQAAVLSPSRPLPVSAPPGCASEPRLVSALNSLPATVPQPGQLPSSDFSILGKYIAVSHQFYDHSLWRAAVQIDRAKSDFDKSGCQRDPSSSSCASTKNGLDHVLSAFPILKSAAAVNTIKSDLFLIVGRGQYEGTAASSPYDYFQSLFPVYDAMRSVGVNPVLADGEWNISSGSPMSSAVHKLQDSIHGLKSDYLNNLQKKINAACDSSAEQLISLYPEVTRQLLLDFSSSTPSLKAALCSFRSFADIRPLRPPLNCAKVTGSPLRAGKSVKISVYGNGDESISLGKDPGDPVTILLHVPFKMDSDIGPEEAKKLLAAWQSKTTDWYNCEAGNRAAPESIVVHDPVEGKEATVSCKDFQKHPLKPETIFRFEFESVTQGEPGAVHLHRCWRAETNSSDCQAIRTSLIKGCVATCKSSAQSQEACQNKCEATLQVADPRNNREDSLNWTSVINDDTVFHEMGHRMGLFDDYTGTSNRDFFQLSGPADSIMMKTDDPNARLYERHLQDILNPAINCGK